MNVNRTMFLALTAALAAGSAACAADAPGTATGSDDVVAEGGSACFANEGEAAMPYEEGTCFDLWNKMQELDYAELTTPTNEGPTPAEMRGCTPYSQSHPAAEGAKLCETWVADFAYSRCQIYVRQFKRESAEHALSCLQSLETTDSMAMYECGYDALDRSCGYHPTAESTCNAIEDAIANKGVTWQAKERDQCMTEVSGLRASARAQLEAAAKSDESWYGLHSAIEGLDPFPF